jgi:hypothetical protein
MVLAAFQIVKSRYNFVTHLRTKTNKNVLSAMTIVIWVFVLWFVSIVFASQSIRDILGSRDKSTEYFMAMKSSLICVLWTVNSSIVCFSYLVSNQIKKLINFLSRALGLDGWSIH